MSGPVVPGGQTFTVSAGQTVTSTTVLAGGKLTVLLEGAALGTTLSGREIVQGSASETDISANGNLVVLGGGTDLDAIVGSGGYETVLGSAVAPDVKGKLFVGSGGTLTSGTIGSGGKAVVSAGGMASATILGSGGEEDDYGQAVSATVVSGGLEIAQSGGTANGTQIEVGGRQIVAASGTAIGTVDRGRQDVTGVASGTLVESGGLESVNSGGMAIDSIIDGGTLELHPGASLRGPLTFASGGTLQIDGTAIPSNVISGFGPGDTLDLRSVSIRSGGSISLLPENILQVSEGGQNYQFHLAPLTDLYHHTLQLVSDGFGGVALRDLAGPAGGITVSAANYDTIYLGPKDTVVGGAHSAIIAAPGAVIRAGSFDVIDLHGLTAETGGAIVEDTGTAINDTILGFAEGVDHLAFAGAKPESKAQVIASARLINGNTVLNFPDGSTITLTGIVHVDGGIFQSSSDLRLSVRLTKDTGFSHTDGLTRDDTIEGKVTGHFAQLTGGLDDAPIASFATLTNQIQTDGSFVLSSGLLDQLAGGKLENGVHTLHLVASDGGQSKTVTITFNLDTAPPAAPTTNLAAADQSGTAAHPAAQSAFVTLVGQTEPNVRVRLLGTEQTTLASNTGSFQFTNVALAPGANRLVVEAVDAAGNASRTALHVQRVTNTGTDPILAWNQSTLAAIALDADAPTVASRTLAMESLAVFDAVSGINGTPGYLINMTAPSDASVEAAVAAAADQILDYLYPAQAATFDAQLAAELAGAPTSAASDGVAFGRAVADRIIALRAHDGSQNNLTDLGGSGVGVWQPTPPGYALALTPQWASLEPFVLSSPDEFLPPPPPDPTSAAYAAAVNETERLGSADSATRTADETQIAKYWNDQAGTYTPAGNWNAIADQVAAQQGDSLSQEARLLAELNVALADAGIAAWNAKFTYNAWRPVTAIRDADSIGNPDITADPNWTPLITTPPFPEYVAGHPTYSAAAAQILDSFFGNDYAFSFTDPADGSLPGLTRSFTSFGQAAQEAGDSRIYGGIHFSFSIAAGLTVGTQVGNATLVAFDLTQDKTPPRILLDQTSGLVTNQDPVVTGDVTDNLSGAAGLAVSLDSGAAVPAVLNPDGSFAVPVVLPLDGSADGSHHLSFVAVDASGNASNPISFEFTVDTKVPLISLSASGVEDGGMLGTGVLIVGTADPTGSPLVQLSYAFDGGAQVPVAFAADSGAFDQALDLTSLAAGAHTLTLSALDAAGNSVIDVLHVSLPALPVLSIAGITPMAGAGDVGVTYRPKVTFSRAVDPTTLTASSFFATDSTGTVVPATIVPSADDTSAWLFFNNPMPGASTITLHVDGSGIAALADGTLLDAAGTGTPGSNFTETFTTVSTDAVPGTTITGIVVDPGPDDTPMTPDDVKAGPLGQADFAHDTWLLPIAGVKVYVLGHEDDAVFTDAGGHFTLTNVPSGDVKVEFDGTTATNDPPGLYFPVMVMDATIRPGVANTLPGSMGAPDEQAANAANPAVYLPRLDRGILTPVSNSEPTVVTVPPGAAGATGNFGLTDQQLGQLSLTVQPGSIVDANGNPVADPQVGIAPVPPQLVKDMLPPGLLQHTFDITIQVPDGAAFTQPATLTMPNVFGLAPGEKTYILSFDHTTGRLVIDGTGTVSADGQTVTSDPGSGVTAPGWHGMTPPGSDGKTSDPPPPDCTLTHILGQIFEGSAATLIAKATDCLAMIKNGNPVAKLFSAISDLSSAFATSQDLVKSAEELYQEIKDGSPRSVVIGTLGALNATKEALVLKVELAVPKVNAELTAVQVVLACASDGAAALDKLFSDIKDALKDCDSPAVNAILAKISDVLVLVDDAASTLNDVFKKAEDAVVKFSSEKLLMIACDQLTAITSYLQNHKTGVTQSIEDAATASTGAQMVAKFLNQMGAFNTLTNNFTDDLTTTSNSFSTLTSDQIGMPSALANIQEISYGGPANAYYLLEYGGLEFRGRLDKNGSLDYFSPRRLHMC